MCCGGSRVGGRVGCGGPAGRDDRFRQVGAASAVSERLLRWRVWGGVWDSARGGICGGQLRRGDRSGRAAWGGAHAAAGERGCAQRGTCGRELRCAAPAVPARQRRAIRHKPGAPAPPERSAGCGGHVEHCAHGVSSSVPRSAWRSGQWRPHRRRQHLRATCNSHNNLYDWGMRWLCHKDAQGGQIGEGGNHRSNHGRAGHAELASCRKISPAWLPPRVGAKQKGDGSSSCGRGRTIGSDNRRGRPA